MRCTPFGLLGLLACSACHQVFGTTATDERERVTAQVVYRHVATSITGAPSVTNATVYAPESVVASGFAGEVTVDVDYDTASGTFAFEHERGERYRLVLAFGSTVYELQSRMPMLEHQDVFFGRPDLGEPITATLQGDVTFEDPEDPVEELTIVTTGVWSNSRLVLPTSRRYSLAWMRPPLAADKNDRIYLLGERREPTHRVVDRMFSPTAPPFSIGPGANELDGLLLTLPPEACTHVDTAIADEAARLASAYAAFSTPAEGWIIHGIPEPLVGIDVATPLASSIAAAPAATVQLVAALPSHAFMVTSVANRSREVELGDQRFTLAVGSRRVDYAKTARDCADLPAITTTMPVTRVAMPTGLVLGDTPLDAVDGAAPVVIDASAPTLELAWQTADAPADLYIVFVRELVAPAVPSPLPAQPGPSLRTIRTTEPVATIDTSLFAPGRHYVFEIRTRLGHPGAPRGDLVTYEYPLELVITTSSVFTVSSSGREPVTR